MLSGNKSINETYTITPADNPRAHDRNRVLLALAKNASKLPTPVDNPATKVSPNAAKIVPNSIVKGYFLKISHTKMSEILANFKIFP